LADLADLTDKEYKMNIHRMKLLTVAGSVALALSATNANATLELLGAVDIVGTGLGAVNTILTITSPANSTTESGSVSWNGTDDVTSGDTQAINHTLTIGDIGAATSSELRIVFNPVEPGNDTNGVTLDNLIATIYSPGGTPLWNSGDLPASIFFSTTDLGTGKSGFLFGLDVPQAAAAQAFWDSANRVGLYGAVSDATGGHETFFALAAPVPEPETYSMMLAGLGIMGLIARRRARKQ
jgi:hypothetical protein